MQPTNGLRRLLLLVFVLAFVAGPSACIDPGGEPPAGKITPSIALRRRFPDHSALVLERGEAFAAVEDGFALSRPGAAEPWRRVDVLLPREGGTAIRFRGLVGAEVRVTEIGASGVGRLAERAVAYPRRGGTSFWTADGRGVEEWLHLEAGTVRVGEAAAAWEIEGAAVRQRGEAVEVVTPDGMVRLTVTAPAAYAAGGREIAARLVGSGARIELHVDTGGEAVLVDPLWMPVAPMSAARVYHVAASLTTGDVLVAGGYDPVAFPPLLASAELFHPATGTWSPAGAMSQARERYTATRLGNGKVLVAGGYGGKIAELYDPATNTWSPAGSMSKVRYDHTASLLASGKVLVAGGLDDANVSLASAELYDPATNTWSKAGSMSQARDYPAAAVLGSGKVLVVGGADQGAALASAELYDPATFTWSAAGAMGQARYLHTATLLGSGEVLAVGGVDPATVGDLASAERYDPATNIWSPAGAMSQKRSNHSATRIPGGGVLVAGGYKGLNAELYAPATNTWSPAGAMGGIRYLHTATLLASGQVLVAGGSPDDFSLSSAELYTPPPTPLGGGCTLAFACESGFCVDGVCCDAACDGRCDGCSVAAGAATDGTCAALTGPPCDDADACTRVDACQVGVCKGGDPVVCAAPDACHLPGSCDPATGACAGGAAKPDDTPCDDGNACTKSDTCRAGVCTGASPITCEPQDACHGAGTCDPASGQCAAPASADGASCPGGECHAGLCVDAGCGCRVGSTNANGGLWPGLALLMALGRRRRARR